VFAIVIRLHIILLLLYRKPLIKRSVLIQMEQKQQKPLFMKPIFKLKRFQANFRPSSKQNDFTF